MVKLLIDGMPVNLPANLSIEFYDRNPLFSKEGRHTLDIDINLADAQNAFVYKNMYRIDVLKRPSGRTAVLYSERGSIIRGTEVVLSIDNRMAKIQIVAGNSELNYLSGGDCRIRDLDLGEVQGLNRTKAWNSLSGSYPTWDYVCTPVATQAATGFSGIFVQKAKGVNDVWWSDDRGVQFTDETVFCPQPYLVAMIHKVITALGYTITNDFISTDDALCHVILINGYNSVKFNEMMPNWKVNDFLTEVEKFTGCIIVANQAEKTVEIIQQNAFYNNATSEVISQKDIVGEVEKKYDEKSPDGVLYHNIEYDFPSTEIYNYWSVERGIMNSLAIQQCEWQRGSVQNERYFYYLLDIWMGITGDGVVPQFDDESVPDAVVEAYNKMIAYKDLGLTNPGLFVIRGAKAYNSGGPFHMTQLRRINHYGPRYDNRTDDTMTLKIMPAEIVWGPYWQRELFDARLQFQQPYPLARNSNETVSVTSEDEKGLNEYIANGGNDDSNSGNLYVAFYMGFQNNNYAHDKAGNDILSPTAAPSPQIERFYHEAYGWWRHQELIRYNVPANYEMAINGEHGMYERYWKNNLSVNFTQPYVIHFRNTQTRDVRSIFVIANKKFYCQELKYNIVGDSVSEIVEGTFFPVITDNDETYTGEDIAIAIQIDKSNGYVRLYSDKLLDWPITVQLSGLNGSNTYSALIDMAAGVSQKSTNISWVMEGTNFAAAIYNHDTDDANTYSFTISVKNPQ